MTSDLSPLLFAPSVSHSLCPPHPHPPLFSLSHFQAKVDNEIIDYRDLAAIPRVKAIYDIEHPDMISYKNDNSSTLDNKGSRQDRQSPAEVTRLNDAPSYTIFNDILCGFDGFSWFDL